MKNQLIILGIILGIIGIIIVTVQAQVVGRISPRCNANGILEIDYAYKIHAPEGYTNYEAILTAGRCTRQFRGQIRAISNVNPSIVTDINAELLTRNLTFYPDLFKDMDIDGRGFFSIP